MNFLQTRKSVSTHNNATTDKEQTKVAANFVEELLDLEAVWTLAEGREILTCSLLCPREGQEGGQNERIAGDPVFLPRISHALDQMCAGGHSAAADASKCFCQFPAHPDDWPFLGLRHLASCVLMPVCQWKEQTVRQLPACVACLFFEC